MQAFGKLSPVVGGVAALGGGAAAALLSIEGAAIGLAIHTAESAAKLGELAQRTGVSTEALAGFAVAGKAVGVDIDTMAKAPELMNVSAVKAAIAPEGAKTAYSRLGITVKDTSGKMKDSSDLFLEVAGKLSNIPQPEEGFFARQIFGKGGIAMIPVIELGVQRLKEIADEAKAAGLGDPATVAASQKFKETMEDISVLTQGVAMRLTKDLLPALTFVAEYVEETFKTGSAQQFIDKLAEITRYTIAMGGTFTFAFREWTGGGELIQTVSAKIIEAIMLIGEASAKPWVIFETDFKNRVSNLNFASTIKGAFSTFSTEAKQAKTDMDAFIDGVMFSTARPPSGRPPKTGSADIGTEAKDSVLVRIRDRINALMQETADWSTPKTNASAATIGVSPEVIARVHRLKTLTVEVRAGRATRRFQVVKSAGPDDLVFQSVKDGKPMSDQNVLKRHIQPVARRLGLNFVDWHCLRRSYATWLVQSGADPKSVQGQMRHSRISTTLDIYAQAVPVTQRRAVERLSEFAKSRVPQFVPLLSQ
jgi:hypothetical protein